MSSIKEKKEPRLIEDTIECVEELARILKENDLGRIKVSTPDDVEILVEAKPRVAPPVGGIGAMPAPAAPRADKPEEKPAEDKIGGNFITSPIIGTFYTSPSPEKPTFVKIGDTINAGDVVCIIESMKLMNEINSEFSGRVAEIYVNNGDSVEYGQKLMRIE